MRIIYTHFVMIYVFFIPNYSWVNQKIAVMNT